MSNGLQKDVSFHFYGSGGITRPYSTGNLRVHPNSFLECFFAKAFSQKDSIEISIRGDERAIGAHL